jgi:hypothetical protein
VFFVRADVYDAIVLDIDLETTGCLADSAESDLCFDGHGKRAPERGENAVGGAVGQAALGDPSANRARRD